MSKPLVMCVNAPFLTSTNTFNLGQELIRALENDNGSAVRHILTYSQAELDCISAADLGQALTICIQRGLDFYYVEIFKLRNARDIPANGQWGLGSALIETVLMQDLRSLQCIQSHPNFKHIQANGAWGLGSALEAHIGILKEKCTAETGLPELNPAYLNSIIGHPHANQIQFQDAISDAIGDLLLLLAVQSEKRFSDHDQEVVIALLHENVSHLIQSNGQFGLGRVLLNAAYATTPFIVNAILNRPGALLINSATTHVNETTQVEEDHGIRCFGFTEIIFAAVNNGGRAIDEPLQVQAQVVHSLLSFAGCHGKLLGVNNPFGLADSLTSAASVNELLVPILLNFPASNDIAANAQNDDDGSLSNALYNASLVGYEQAMKCILQHPNARQLSTQNFQDAYSAADRANRVKAAELICFYWIGKQMLDQV